MIDFDFANAENMPVKTGGSIRDAVITLPIHFNLPAHALPLNTFITTADETRRLIHALNDELFNGELKFEILVLPPQEGTFKTTLGVRLLAGWIALWTFAESDFGKSFIKGLTLNEPAYWSEMAGKSIRTWIENYEQTEQLNAAEIKEAQNCLAASGILVKATTRFLQEDTETLSSIGLTPRKLREAYAARNEFYKACAAIPEIQAVGFEDGPSFPITRDKFASLTVPLLPKHDDDDDPWTTGIVTLKATSPNWVQEDRRRRWLAKDEHEKARLFLILDQQFWELAKAKALTTDVIDTMKVQWAYQGTELSPKKIRVLRVLEFNHEKLSDPLDDNALRAILGNYRSTGIPLKSIGKDTDQGDLFS